MSCCLVVELLESDLHGVITLPDFEGFHPEQLHSILSQLIKAIHCCLYKIAPLTIGLHEHGIVHGDLKPENILLLNSNMVKDEVK
jgi:serine/threonine protein kinase